MPSWQARAFNALTRLVVRRRSWGHDDQALARRARRVFGAPRAYAWLVSTGLDVRPLRTRGAAGAVRGEWIVPKDADRSAGAATLLYVHGGGYVSCSAATHRPITAALARRTGMRVLSADYRLAPEHPFPAALDDVVAAYRWLLDAGVPAPRVAVAGDSAGGGLALGLLVRAVREGLPMPACVACFSPLTDLEGTGESARRNAGRDPMFFPENTASFAHAYVGRAVRTLPELSLVHADAAGWPPMLFQVAETELLLDDATRVHERVIAAGGTSTLSVYGDVFHCWQMLVGVVPEAGTALDEAAGFLRGGVVRATAAGVTPVPS